jgi:hypothetical protein
MTILHPALGDWLLEIWQFYSVTRATEKIKISLSYTNSEGAHAYAHTNTLKSTTTKEVINMGPIFNHYRAIYEN